MSQFKTGHQVKYPNQTQNNIPRVIHQIPDPESPQSLARQGLQITNPTWQCCIRYGTPSTKTL